MILKLVHSKTRVAIKILGDTTSVPFFAKSKYIKIYLKNFPE